MPADPVQVRRVEPADWPALKALRLEALADTPIAYLETLEQALGLDDAAWQARAARGSVHGDSCQVLAWSAGRPTATAVGFLDPERRGTAVLAAAYVSPAARGTGLLDRLLEPVTVWARLHGCTVLRLWVHEDNGRARAAYDARGFLATGQTMAYPVEPSQRELALELALGPPLPGSDVVRGADVAESGG